MKLIGSDLFSISGNSQHAFSSSKAAARGTVDNHLQNAAGVNRWCTAACFVTSTQGPYTYDACKIFEFSDHLPLCHTQNHATSLPFVCILGNPSPPSVDVICCCSPTSTESCRHHLKNRPRRRLPPPSNPLKSEWPTKRWRLCATILVSSRSRSGPERRPHRRSSAGL